MYGHYEFVLVHFGFINVPTTFMYLMNNLLHPYLDSFSMLFIDDILIYSKNEEENVEHLGVVLRFLIENQSYAKLRKCSLF